MQQSVLVVLGALMTRGANDDGLTFDWGYSSNNGPLLWGSNDPAAALCDSPTSPQSPIDVIDKAHTCGGTCVPDAISSEKINRPKHLRLSMASWRPLRLPTLRNDGRMLVLDASGDELHTTFEGHRYALKELRFHVGSEHTINGHQFAMEMQAQSPLRQPART